MAHVTTCSENIHRPGLIRPAGSAEPKSNLGTHRFYISTHSRHAVYNSSEIDKTRYCPPSRWTEKGGPMASFSSV